MRNYFKDGFDAIRKALFEDYINLYLLSGVIFLSLVDVLIWKFVLSIRDIYIFYGMGIYPIRYLMIILIINTVLALFSYDKEKEISYLLLSANVMATVLIFILEIFYLFNSH